METNKAMRQRVARLLDVGFNQKALAKKIGVSPSVFNRWINERRDKSLDMDVMDKFNAFVLELSVLVEELKDPLFIPGEGQRADKVHRLARGSHR